MTRNRPTAPVEVVALDAMGVLYESADDVADLLVPYARAKGSTLTAERIEELYTTCSLGLTSTAELWQQLGTQGADDEEYCRGHRLTEGTKELLEQAGAAGLRTACLSNDVSAWSRLLRTRFELDGLLDTWVISGDIGARKPAPEAYAALCDAVDTPPGRVLFVDDRARNVLAAREAGLQAVHFGPQGSVASMKELGVQLERAAAGWS